MTLYKFVTGHNGNLTWRTLRNVNNVPPIVLAVTRDGSIYFALFVNINLNQFHSFKFAF